MQNLINLHTAQLASDRMSCHSATDNQVRLVIHTARSWLIHGVRAAFPKNLRVRYAPRAPNQDRRGAIEHNARIRVQLPTSFSEGALFRTVALGLLRSVPRTAEPRAPTSRRWRQIDPKRVIERVALNRSSRTDRRRTSVSQTKTRDIMHDCG
jgi:hypothetical protein